VITQSSFGGKVLVLNFWATWCPPCISELPSLSAMAEQLKPEGVVVLGVSIDKNQQAYKRFLRQARPAFETAQDPEANISTQFGTFKWPETYVIDRNGKVAQKYISDRDWTSPEIVANLRSLL
jgi:thiol-disulfide isomerase/thioredoxin